MLRVGGEGLYRWEGAIELGILIECMKARWEGEEGGGGVEGVLSVCFGLG